jgi:hypothetical protein
MPAYPAREGFEHLAVQLLVAQHAAQAAPHVDPVEHE